MLYSCIFRETPTRAQVAAALFFSIKCGVLSLICKKSVGCRRYWFGGGKDIEAGGDWKRVRLGCKV